MHTHFFNFAGVEHLRFHMFHPHNIKMQHNAHVNAEGLDLRLESPHPLLHPIKHRLNVCMYGYVYRTEIDVKGVLYCTSI